MDERAQNRCEAISPVTGERCICRTNLQYDHIKSVAFGGMSSKDNIRKLCFGCNQRAGIEQLGVKKMHRGATATSLDVKSLVNT